jgi:hypothetical protein
MKRLAGKVVYLSGGITGVPGYRRLFAAAERAVLGGRPRHVFNPAALWPAGWTYEHYMEHDLILVRRSDAVVMLWGWEASPGALAEFAYARSLGKDIYLLGELATTD